MVAKDVIQHPALPHGDPLRPGIVVFGDQGPLLLVVRTHIICGYPIDYRFYLLPIAVINELCCQRGPAYRDQPVLGIILQIVGVAADDALGQV